jgi:hypothetical protein
LTQDVPSATNSSRRRETSKMRISLAHSAAPIAIAATSFWRRYRGD